MVDTAGRGDSSLIGDFVEESEIQRVFSRFSTSRVVHMVFIGTKPDIIKQYPVFEELRRRGEQVVVCHSGQHTDYEYSEGMLVEFGMGVDIRLVIEVHDSLGAKVSALVARANELFVAAGRMGHTVIPYIHGDTMTSMAVGVAAHMNRVACVHVEAGIRTLTPRADFFRRHFKSFRDGVFDWDVYAADHLRRDTFSVGSMEPYPEQFNTRVSDSATGLHAAPVPLDRDFLLSEGYPSDSIVVVGNTVVDATLAAAERARTSGIFDRFPQLASGEFIRICIHRRETTNDRERFVCYFDAMELLLQKGRSVLWVSLKGTEWALSRWGLTSRLKDLVERYPDTLISTTVWPEYGDVIASVLKCSLLATDSGSMQEEANTLGVPCVTLRFGSDRGESLLAGGNVLAPPLSPGFVAEVILGAYDRRHALVAEPLYGHDCASKLVDEVLARAAAGTGLFRSEEMRLQLHESGDSWPLGDERD